MLRSPLCHSRGRCSIHGDVNFQDSGKHLVCNYRKEGIYALTSEVSCVTDRISRTIRLWPENNSFHQAFAVTHKNQKHLD
jgi:hypothetical protein